MPPTGRSSSSLATRSSPRDVTQVRQNGRTSRRPQPSHPPGPGFIPLLMMALLLGGTGTVLVRSGAFSNRALPMAAEAVSTCPGPLNRWADQRLLQRRRQLEQDHAIYRSHGANPSAIGAAMIWIDDRIIERHLAAERQQLRSTLMRSSRCLVEFQP